MGSVGGELAGFGLIRAVEKKDAALVRVLLEKVVAPGTKFEGNPELMEGDCPDRGAEGDEPLGCVTTALKGAARSGDVNMSGLLLRAVVDLPVGRKEDKVEALRRAVCWEYEDIVEMFFKAGLPPRRPLSAFHLYFNEMRVPFCVEYPRLEFREVGRILVERWRDLSESERQEYDKKAEEDRERYEKERAIFELSLGEFLIVAQAGGTI
ncbi:Non-histone chromosomal protein 6 [Rhizophlyctis rosea]|nr:Non-histone chromosomal protein 6 [Rhizophlyctis rosea]